MFAFIKQNWFAIIAGWLSMLAFDFLLHAGIMAKTYAAESPFLLSAQDAFTRIPLGYFSFLILNVVLVWLMADFKIFGKKKGAFFGLKIGGIMWASFAIGLYSISTAPAELLFGWWLGQTLEMGIAGYFIGAYFSGTKKRSIIIWLILLFIICVVLTIILQATGFAPAMEMK